MVQHIPDPSAAASARMCALPIHMYVLVSRRHVGFRPSEMVLVARLVSTCILRVRHWGFRLAFGIDASSSVGKRSEGSTVGRLWGIASAIQPGPESKSNRCGQIIVVTPRQTNAIAIVNACSYHITILGTHGMKAQVAQRDDGRKHA
jgi:hypothetical protein